MAPTRELSADLKAHQVKLYEATEELVGELGQFDRTPGAKGAHYVAAADNPFGGEGLQCANCAFYAGPRACEIVAGDIDPAAICKFWIIPENLIVTAPAPPPEMATARSIETETFRRAESVSCTRAAGADRTMDFSFSSEYPVPRYFGSEVLSQDRTSVV